MDPELIQAMSHLWPLALVLCLMVWALLFRASIRALLSQLAKLQVKVRREGVDIVLASTEQDPAAPASNAPVGSPVRKPVAPKSKSRS
jgi:hypothetical protein